MSQAFHTLFETNKMLDDVARHNDNYSSLRSSFSGTSFPPSPTVGQICWRTDKGLSTASGTTGKLYKFCGDTSIGDVGWVTDVETSEVTSEVINSRGSKGSLDQRLDISLNEDGTLRATAAAYSSEWILASVTFSYVDASTFTTTGNTSDIFTPTRRVKVNLDTSYSVTEVVSSTYTSGTDTTSVTIKDAVLDGTLVSVEHAIIAPFDYNGAMSYYTRDEVEAKVSTLQDNIDTNTTNIATNTNDIASNVTSIRLKADKAQDINTSTIYTDSVTGTQYKLYIANSQLLIEEL
jgi:hypothetical protein